MLRRLGTLALACALVLATDASAAPPQYLSQSGTLNPDTAGEIPLACPAGTKAVGGGAFLSGTSLETEIRSSAPFDGADRDKAPDDGWIAAGNPGPTQETLTTHAICAAGRFGYVSQKKRVLPGFAELTKAKCPKGRRAISGGVKAPNPFFNPSTEVKLGRTYGTGGRTWKGMIYNGSTVRLTMRVWAVCANAVTGFTRTNDLPPGMANNTQGSIATDTCSTADAHVTGIGAEFLNNPGGAEIASLRPLDVDDDDTEPDDGAKAWFNNQTGASQLRSVIAVCAAL